MIVFYEPVMKLTPKSPSPFFLFCFLGQHLQHMEVPRLGVKWELQLLAYTTAIAMPDLSLICDLHHSSRQCRILNPLREARDRTCHLMIPSQISLLCTMTGTPYPSVKQRNDFPPEVPLQSWYSSSSEDSYWNLRHYCYPLKAERL